jgi:hypothetical protein
VRRVGKRVRGLAEQGGRAAPSPPPSLTTAMTSRGGDRDEEVGRLAVALRDRAMLRRLALR